MPESRCAAAASSRSCRVLISTAPPLGIASRAAAQSCVSTCSSWFGSATIGSRFGIGVHTICTRSPTSRRRVDRQPGDELVEIQHARRQHLAAAEGEQLAGQCGGPVGRPLDLAQVLATQGGEPRLLLQQRHVAQDAREQVVEVVGDAAGELADGLHPLRPDQALLELPAIGDVGAAPDQPAELAARARSWAPRRRAASGTARRCRRTRYSSRNGSRWATARPNCSR